MSNKNKKREYRFTEPTMGVCYYPEHWDRSLWEEDLLRMLDAGISIIRIGEFAWSKTEPSEGKFVYDFFDDFLKLCKKTGMKVIMGTPTATPPAWLTEKYPEVLNADIKGNLYKHGGRRHYNYNSPKYRELCKRIVKKLAKHYGKHPSIIGWQIDNELNCECDLFFSKADDVAFRAFLKNKYKKIEVLNEAWGTEFWNQMYTSFEEVHLPSNILSNGKNPHRYLDYYRFISASAIEFCSMQSEILREYIPDDVFITTNGLFAHLDNHKMTKECLDIYTYDTYPDFAYDLSRTKEDASDLDDRHWSRYLSEVRSVCPHFAIMEQQSGANGWVSRLEAPAPRPGKLRLWALQSVAHGADMISFFRWRTCTMGTEMYWHGILDYDNRDNRKLNEVKKFFSDFKKLSPIIGSDYVAELALMRDYDNVWDAETDNINRRVQSQSEEAIFEATQLNHTPYNIVYINDKTKLSELNKYKVIIYPHPLIMTEKRAELLKEYVRNGGTLIIGCRSGYKDITGKCVMLPQPGLLAEITGSDVIDFTFTSPREDRIMSSLEGMDFEMSVFNDVLKIADGEDEGAVKVISRYKNGYYEHCASIIEKKYGKGFGIHFGAAFNRESVKALLNHTGILEPYKGIFELPEEAELVVRRKGEKNYYIILNYSDCDITINVNSTFHELITDSRVNGEFTLGANSVAVFS